MRIRTFWKKVGGRRAEEEIFVGSMQASLPMVAAFVHDDHNVDKPTSCQSCFTPLHLHLGQRVNFCRGNQKHAFCSPCIQQYVEHWMEDETWPDLKQQFDGSSALPCLLSHGDGEFKKSIHYLPSAVIRQNITEELWRRFQAKMERIYTLSMSLIDDGYDYDDTLTAEGRSTLTETTQVSTESTWTTTPPSTQICQCCFEGISTLNVENGYYCQGHNHFLCVNCIRRYVEEWLYSGTCALQLQKTPTYGWALPCPAVAAATAAATGNDVPHYLPESVVRQSISDKRVFHRYCQKIEAVSSRAARAASIDNEPAFVQEQQPTELELPREENISTNSAVEAARRTRVQKPNAANSMEQQQKRYFHQAAEALTEAMMRRCPSCHTQFFKESDSCNKIRCPHCQVAMCYVCRQTLPSTTAQDSSYSHFCNHNPVSRATPTTRTTTCRWCSKCPLWSIPETDEQQRRQSIVADVANRAWEDLLLQNKKLTPPSVAGEQLGLQLQRNIDRLL